MDVETNALTLVLQRCRGRRVAHVENENGLAISASHLTSHRSVVVADWPCSARISDPVNVYSEPPLVVDDSDYDWFSGNCGLTGAHDRQESGAFLLDALADDGGAVPTRLPAAGSVLIDQIPSDACPLKEDARGVTRPQGAACDIGAVEVSAKQ